MYYRSKIDVAKTPSSRPTGFGVASTDHLDEGSCRNRFCYRQTFTADDLIDFTPALHAEAVEIAKRFVLGSLFTPPTLKSDDPHGTQGTAYLPGWVGGANWTGAAFDPDTAFVHNKTQYIVVAVAGIDHEPEFVALTVGRAAGSQ